ncbi:hypothetical protein GBA52_009204 [Prunus armeniaca]|nr:hypothetical protein GBA52_009204 [Prunus armeniaca]
MTIVRDGRDNMIISRNKSNVGCFNTFETITFDVKSWDIKTHYLQTKATNSLESATDKVLQPTPTSKILFALGLGSYGFVLGPKLMFAQKAFY